MSEEVEKLRSTFKDHVLTNVLDTEKFKVFDFKNKSGSGTNYQRWIIDHGTLIITRDNYNSIYRWNDNWVSLEFLAQCGIWYFNEKCLADKDGRQQKFFSPEGFQESIIDIITGRLFDAGEIDVSNEVWINSDTFERLEHCEETIEENTNYATYQLDNSFLWFDNPQDASDFLCDEDNEFLLGSDGWEYCSEINTLTIIPKIHLAALREANERYPNAF